MTRETVGGPNQLDLAIGRRMRARRREVGLSQQALAESLGVSFQLVQKYEEGADRIDVARLVQVADALQCRASDLAAGLEAGPRPDAAAQPRSPGPDAAELLEVYSALPGDDWRETLLQQARALLRLARKGGR